MTPPESASQSSLLSGYILLEQLYQGTRTIVYRGMKTGQSCPVVIKAMRLGHTSFSELVQFRNQYTITKNLPIPGIVRPLSLEPLGSGYALVMEDCGGVSLAQYLHHHSLGLAEVLAIALQLTDTLHRLGQHRVVHKDIKPANILIHPESKQVRLIDFSIASLLPKETQELQNPNTLEGTLAYLAPEQTGRMNRGIDYRADFYALGVTLYQLLAGCLPFASADPLELVHCHIAQIPKPLDQVNPEVPVMVAAIVARLMAKNAEDRYQSALGIKHDLQVCLDQWKATGKVVAFQLRQQDSCDRFLIPEKIYGRDAELCALLDAFDRVAAGDSELMLVAGRSGIGKTAVVNEIHKPITCQNGYFIKGKFDQLNRNVPFSGFVQAFQSLVEQLLGEPDTVLEQWKHKILAAVGVNGQVILEVIPELECIIGAQPVPAKLSGSAAQTRFNRLFDQFVQVFAGPDHPLVIFLDDLQWADLASLKLLKCLLDREDFGTRTDHLLVLGAYRDNEVFPAHPLMSAVAEIKQQGVSVETLRLLPLKELDINQLVAETLRCPVGVAQPLSQLVYRKTHGNPFFTAQFLQALHAEQHITFNAEDGQWQCDLAQVQEASLTDDVVEFMVKRLRTLPLPTQDVLKFAACIGNRFDLASLSAVYAASSGLQASQEQVTADLWQALQIGLIIPESETYKFFAAATPDKEQQQVRPHSDAIASRPIESITPAYRFLHDRVQQAAYALIPETEKAVIHCTLGKGLLAQLSSLEREEMLFTIVGQLNLGRDVFASAAERAQLAELNLKAGRKARMATAYGAAVDYLAVARQSLAPDCWQTNYATTLNIFVETLKTHYLNTHFDLVKSLADHTLTHTQTLLDKIKVYEVLIRTSVAQGDQHQALETGLQVLQMLNIELLEDKPAAVANVAALMDSPAMTDPHMLAAMRIMAYIVTPAWAVNPVYFRAITFTMVELSLMYGNCGASAFGYAWYGTLLCEALGDIDEGYGFGRLSIALLDRFDAQDFRSKVLNLYASCTRFWKEHLKESFPVHLEGVKWGLETGDLEFASYSAVEYCHYLLLAGSSLHQVRDMAQQKLAFVQHLKQSFHIDYLAPLLQASLNLTGESGTLADLDGSAYTETERLPNLIAEKQLTTVFVVYFLKSILSYLFEDIEQALAYGQKAREYSAGVTGTFFISAELFYSSLARIAALDRMEPVQQQVARQDVNECLAKLQHWATYAPMNYQHKCDLLVAELAKHEGQFIAAMDAYDRAIAGAKAHDFTHEEALANELAAKFYLHWGKDNFAACYMQEAYYGYARWGSEAKLNDLVKRYRHLLQPILQQIAPSTGLLDTLATISPPNLTVYSTGGVSSSSSTSMNSTLDFTSVLRAFQVISDTIQLDDLLQQLTQIMLQTSGGDRCILALPGSKNRWQIRADASADDCTLEAIPFADNPPAPVQLMRYVRNTQEILVVDSLGTELPIVDAYLTENRPQSLVCLPMMYHDHLVGVLYLHNQFTRRAFSRERILVLNFLCTQAAISIENARLYRQEQKRSHELAQKEAEYRSIFEGVNDGLSIISLETGQMVAVNPTMCRMYGYAQDEWATLQPSDYVHASSLPGFANFIDVLTQGEAFYAQASGLHKDGSTLDLEVKAVPLMYQGKPHGLSIIRDISDRKRAERAILEKSQALEKAMAALQNTQLQMVQSEKMASLGNLVAGVAHEINNPVGFLKGSVKHSQDYFQNLLNHLAYYQELYPDPEEEIQEHAEEIGLGFIAEDFPKLLESMTEAVARIKSISTSLRTFSRADAEHKGDADLHAGLNSTIMILKYRLKADGVRPAIQVEKHYGDLPEVHCFPGQLNQVFMNILANSIDVFDDAAQQTTFDVLTEHPQIITIRTTLTDGNTVEIRIGDNGKGMSEVVKARAFDHLYTTKKADKGTGLGLAIARQIVEENHSGCLTVESELGKGTEFIISLPMNPQE